MPRSILSILNDEDLDCLPCDRVNLDIERFTEYRDSDEHPAEALFENPLPTKNKIEVEIIGTEKTPTILRYFLDGSRRTYKIADILLDRRKYLPLIAGQVGVAVVSRDDNGKNLKPLRDYCCFKNVIAFPDVNISKEDLPYFESQINNQAKEKFSLLRYSVKKDRDPVDLGVAQIMKHMQDLEIGAVASLSQGNMLANDSLLVIDGPLRFREIKGRPFDVVQFRNVIGLSKTFRPSFTVGKGRKQEDVGTITSCLNYGERTPVFKTVDEKKVLGMWYLRIRPPEKMFNPLQGVVKIECYAIDQEEKENGLDSERVNIISGYILRERNVSPYKADPRWASHIYPVYLAEKYLKCSFMSDTKFQALF